MITTLTGTNDFARGQKLRQLVRAFQDEHGEFALEKLDGEDASTEQMRASVESLPFLTSRKLVVLREPGKQKPFTEQIDVILDAVTDTTDVIIVEPKLDKRLTYYKTLKKRTDFQEYTELDAKGLVPWAIQYVTEKGGSLSRPDATELVDRIGPNQQMLTQEIDKLLLSNPHITTQTIHDLTDKTPQSTMFELLDAAFAGKHERALQLYKDQRSQKVEPQAILAMLAWQLQIIVTVKTAGDRPQDEIAKIAKLNPFVVRKTATVARRHSLAEIKQAVDRLYSIDIRSKRSQLDLDEALSLYLLQL